MYDFIRGEIIEINPALLVIEAGGIGFSVKIFGMAIALTIFLREP